MTHVVCSLKVSWRVCIRVFEVDVVIWIDCHFDIVLAESGSQIEQLW